MGRKAALGAVEKKKILALAGIELRLLGCPAPSLVTVFIAISVSRHFIVHLQI
jgi:hypothetical protein